MANGKGMYSSRTISNCLISEKLDFVRLEQKLFSDK